MRCKHRRVDGNTTKYYYCQIFKKPVDDHQCKNCLMKIEDNSDIIDAFEKIFGGGFNK